MRQRIKKVGGITVIEDCYNASPDSQKAALDVLSSFKSNRRIAVLGDMLELGKYSDVSHENVGKYTENKNIDIRHGVIMLISVLIFTLVGSFVSSLVPNGTMGGFSKGMTLLVGLKFIIRPIMTTKEVQANKSEEQKIRQSILCGVLIGFICGFVGAGGGMMLLLVLTSVLGYELKTAVGTSVFIMTFTALTGAVSHFYIGGKPNFPIMIACVISTLVFAQLGAKWANSANVKMLNRVTGILLCVLGMVMLFF